jgi:hypothetical protein
MQMVTKQDTETSAGFMIAAQMLPNMQCVCVCVTHEKASVTKIALSLDPIAHTHHISQCNASCPGFLKRPLRCYKVAFASELISSHVYTVRHPPKCHFRKLMPTIMGNYAARTSTPKVPSFIQVTNSVPEMPPLM